MDSPGAPEEFDFLRWQLPTLKSGGRQWLLRPELLESIYHISRSSTHDSAKNSWLDAAESALNAIEKWSRAPSTGCGFATVQDVEHNLHICFFFSFLFVFFCMYLHVFFLLQVYVDDFALVLSISLSCFKTR